MACQSVAEIFVIKMANIVGELTICPLMPPSGHTFSVCFCFLISDFGPIGSIRGSNWLLYLLSGLVSLFVLWKLFPMSTCFDGYKEENFDWSVVRHPERLWQYLEVREKLISSSYFLFVFFSHWYSFRCHTFIVVCCKLIRFGCIAQWPVHSL